MRRGCNKFIIAIDEYFIHIKDNHYYIRNTRNFDGDLIQILYCPFCGVRLKSEKE